MRNLPHWLTHREGLGFAADPPGDLSDTTFPLAQGAANQPGRAFEAGGAETALVYWTATGENLASHQITLQPLLRDGVNGLWLRAAATAARPREIVEIPVYGCAACFIRIDAVNAGGAAAPTNVIIRVTLGLEARR